MEFVYVIKRTDLFELEYPQGFLRLSPKELEARYLAKIRQRGFFIERRFAEQDSSFKQIIPYCVVVQREKVLLLRRLNNQGEQRLHQKLSIGVGGHINPIDHGGNDVLTAGTRRELEEEIEIETEPRIEALGIINDDASPVGSVHFGIVHRVFAPQGRVEIREKNMMEGSFATVESLHKQAKEGATFESWSQFLLSSLDSIVMENSL